MSHRRALFAFLLGLPCASAPALAQLTLCESNPPDAPLRFDMGPAGSTTAAGFVLVKRNTGYPTAYVPTPPSSPSAFGWKSIEGSAVQNATPGEFLVHEHDPELLRDSVLVNAGGSGVFQLDRPAGDYMCVVYLGDLGQALEGMDVQVSTTSPGDSFETVVEDAFARMQAPFSRATLTNAWGGYKRVTFKVSVGSAQFMKLKFVSEADGPLGVMGLEVYQLKGNCTDPPIHYDHFLPGFVTGSSNADVQAGVAAFNQHDYAAARDEFDDVAPNSTPQVLLAKAWGYAWLLGWLTDAEEQVDIELLDDTVEILEGLDPDNWAVTGLLQDLRDLRHGALLLKHSGYSEAATGEPNLGYIGPNMKAGLQLCEQMDGDLLLGVDHPKRPESPLCAKAQYLAARSMYMRNTRVMVGTLANGSVDNGSVAYNTYFVVDLLQNKLWPNINPTVSGRLFPKAHEATLLAYRMTAHLAPPGTQQGPGPLEPWDGDEPPGMDFSGVWWADRVDFQGPAGAPLWVQEQRRYANMFRNLGEWWIDRRLIDGELGGGGGDDTEGAAILGVPLVARTEGLGHQPEDGIAEVMEHVLTGSEVNVEEGYYEGPPDDGVGNPEYVYVDHEHGGEYTTYPLYVLSALSPGNPTFIEFAMRNMRNLDDDPVTGDLADTSTCGLGGPDTAWSAPVAWGGIDVFRHCKSNLLSGCKIGPAASGQDALEAMKVLSAGFNLLDHNRHPRLATLWKEYALAWHDAAMSTDTGKPQGIFPAAVDVVSGAFGFDDIFDSDPAPEWWKVDIHANATEMYELMLAMARVHPSLTATFLEPLDWSIDFLANNAPTSQTVTPDGPPPPGWISAQLSDVIASAAFRALDLLPINGGVIADTNEIEDVILTYGTETMKLVYQSRGSNGAQTDKAALAAIYAEDADWLEHYWPFASTLVATTDRLFAFPPLKPAQIGIHALYESQTGAPFTLAPGRPVTWNDPLNGSPSDSDLDFSILVNHVEAGAALTGATSTPPPPAALAFRAMLWNHASADRDINMRICREIPYGSYRLLCGPDSVSDSDDTIDGTATRDETIDIERRYLDITLTVPDGELHVVELYRVSESVNPPCRTDLGIGPDDIVNVGGEVFVNVHNLGTVNFYPATGRKLHVTITPIGGGSSTEDYTDLPQINAATTLTPGTPAAIDTDLAWPADAKIEAELIVDNQCQITTQNDRASKTQ